MRGPVDLTRDHLAGASIASIAVAAQNSCNRQDASDDFIEIEFQASPESSRVQPSTRCSVTPCLIVRVASDDWIRCGALSGDADWHFTSAGYCPLQISQKVGTAVRKQASVLYI
jgi:hypothetical protein